MDLKVGDFVIAAELSLRFHGRIHAIRASRYFVKLWDGRGYRHLNVYDRRNLSPNLSPHMPKAITLTQKELRAKTRKSNHGYKAFYERELVIQNKDAQEVFWRDMCWNDAVEFCEDFGIPLAEV